jgi:predicted TIM-barrel fold metal-dependent hydrolase
VIVDCHAHVARVMTGFREPLRYGKVQDQGQVAQMFPPSFDPPASPPEVLLGYMDQVGVDHTFLVQHHVYGNQNELVLECVRRWPDRFTGFGYLGGMGQPDAADQLERLIENGMAGLKIELPSTQRLRPEFRFDGEAEMKVFDRLNRLGRPLVVDINGAPLEVVPQIRRVIETYPKIHLVVTHVGGAPGEGWQQRARLAKVDPKRGWIDLAALPLFWGVEQEYPYPKAQETVRWAVEEFGADRVMWGTDYPPTLNHGTYRQLLDWVRRHSAFLTDEQRAGIIGGNAERFLKEAGVK